MGGVSVDTPVGFSLVLLKTDETEKAAVTIRAVHISCLCRSLALPYIILTSILKTMQTMVFISRTTVFSFMIVRDETAKTILVCAGEPLERFDHVLVVVIIVQP